MLRAMIVDDSATVRQQVRTALIPEGIEVLEAADAGQALELLERQSTMFNLIIADLNMPGMSGFDLMTEVKRVYGHRAPPILVFTSEVSSELMQRAKAAGAAGWISKPVEAPKLAEAVWHLMR